MDELNLKIGDKLVVNGMAWCPASVLGVNIEEETSRSIILLDWGSFGKSRVYAHDENVVWYRLKEMN